MVVRSVVRVVREERDVSMRVHVVRRLVEGSDLLPRTVGGGC